MLCGTRRYPAPSEVPEGIQHQYDQHAQVIYTRGDGTTAIETWSKGEKVESAEEEAARWAAGQQGPCYMCRLSNEIPAPVTSSTLAQEQEPRLLARGGRPAPAWGQVIAGRRSGGQQVTVCVAGG